MDSLDVSGLEVWTPIRVRGSAAEPLVDWAVIDEPFTDAFFEQTAYRAVQHPFNQVFTRTTPLQILDALAGNAPPVEPAGFVFHMSRCGSTLIAQMLSGLSSTVVLSEPQPLDGVLRLCRAGAWSDECAQRRLRAMLSALVRPRGAAQRVFVKFHAWHVLELPLIARAFPDTPWVFAFREPRAVLRSQEKAPGPEVVPGTLDPRLAGIEPAALAAVSPAEYCARMLAAFCNAALEHAASAGARFVAYEALPGAVLTHVLPLFGTPAAAEETMRMRGIATRDAKGEDAPFRPGVNEPRMSDDLERLAVRWLDPVYDRLRARAAA